MPLPLPLGETLVILRPGTPVRDRAGNYTPGPEREIPVPGCAAWPTSTSERLEAQDQTVELVTVLAPYGTDVRATDQARLWGRVFDVDGEPQPWRSPLTGSTGGVEARLKRTVG